MEEMNGESRSARDLGALGLGGRGRRARTLVRIGFRRRRRRREKRREERRRVPGKEETVASWLLSPRAG